MKDTIYFAFLCLGLLQVAYGQSTPQAESSSNNTKAEAATSEEMTVIPTINKFAVDISKSLQNMITFERKEDLVYIHKKTKGSLPMEFTKKGIVPSDGILFVGDSFMWPGCGFDRTSYSLKEITEDSVVIVYSRGTPAHDGYHDTGEIKIAFEKG